MTARQGLDAARDLWRHKGSDVEVRQLYLAALERYEDVLKQESDRKQFKKRAEEGDDLASLDIFWRVGLVEAVRSRDPPFLTKDDIVRVMKWKLTRGKFRPLLKNLLQNSESLVEQCTRSAFALAGKGQIDAALNELCTLKSIGPATASAVLAPLYPDAPFMDDVPLMLLYEDPKYTVKEYQLLQEELKKKAVSLGGGLTAEDIGRALFTVALASALEAVPGKHNNADRGAPASDQKKRRT